MTSKKKTSDFDFDQKSIKKALIALDYDPTAKKIAEQGFGLAKTMGAEVVLLHVISDPVYYTQGNILPSWDLKDIWIWGQCNCKVLMD